MKTYYSGTDTHGKNIRVATNDGINYFFSVYKFNGYGMSYGKWEKLKHDDRDLTVNSFGDNVYKWGWNELKEIGPHRFKLPVN